ncbi:hypothetical protein CXB51_024059 [Gossypium anomalum]|uniref:Amino acid transporter transmembrane domain-containing protein n=1 Tax=Gossypium anomalum TaxID=47600 RepID=A0A8J5YM07_9ROSI|nr:hypothetical protein CXB51_024059 [Gossypium anomalum]
MGENHRVFIDNPSLNDSQCFDDDGRLKRTGTFWTASAHIITAVIGSGVLSLAWAIAQLGWIAGPAVMLLFSIITFYTSCLLTDCYRTADPVSGKRNYTYTQAVGSLLGGYKVKLCGFIQYVNLFGVSIGAIKRSNCFHNSGGKNPCHMSSSPYMMMFGVAEILLSQIPDFDQIWWLSILAAVMSFTYSGISLAFGIAKVIGIGTFRGSLTGISLGTVTPAQKIWRSFRALGDIAFAYSFSMILIEIQDTVKSPPAEAKTMKKATKLSIAITTAFYMLCGCMGYASFGDLAPDNLLTGFGFYNPFWLLDIANAAIVIHLVGAYQVFCQPIFTFVEKWASQRWPESKTITKELKIPMPIRGYRPYKLNLFRSVWRTAFVMLTTVISMLLPFFGDVVGILGAFGFWPLTVYFPVEMYIEQKKISKWSSRWICLKMLSMGCLMISILAGTGSIAGVIHDLKVYKPFKTTY